MKRFAYLVTATVLELIGCGQPEAFFSTTGRNSQDVRFAIFATQILPASLDGDTTPEGEDILDDAVSELVILAGDQPNLCDIVTDAVESGGTPPEFVELTAAIVIARKFELETPGTGFVPGDTIVTDEAGTSLFGTFKFGSPSFLALDIEQGTLRIDDIDEELLLAEAAFTAREGGSRSTNLQLAIETTEFCPALSLLPLIPSLGL